MKTQYYTKFSVGLIDSLLTRNQNDTDYLIPLTSGTGNTSGGTHVQSGILVRPEKTSNDFEWMMGTSMVEKHQTWKSLDLDTTIHNWLLKQEMKTVLGDLDYDYEYASPFKDGLTKTLLILKWITGIQSITKQEVRISKQDLERIGLNHPPLHYKIIFDEHYGPLSSHQLSKITGRHTRSLSGSLINNKYDPDTKEWVIKIGPRDTYVVDGPGSVRIKTTQFTGLLNMIIEDHNRLIEEQNKPKVEVPNIALSNYNFEFEDKDGGKSKITLLDKDRLQSTPEPHQTPHPTPPATPLPDQYATLLEGFV